MKQGISRPDLPFPKSGENRKQGGDNFADAEDEAAAYVEYKWAGNDDDKRRGGPCSLWEGVGYLPRQSLRGGRGKTDVTVYAGTVDKGSLTMEAYTDTTLNSVRKKNRLLVPCDMPPASCLSLLQKMVHLSLLL